MNLKALMLTIGEMLLYMLLIVACVTVLVVLAAWSLQGVQGDFFGFVRDLGHAWRGEKP